MDGAFLKYTQDTVCIKLRCVYCVLNVFLKENNVYGLQIITVQFYIQVQPDDVFLNAIAIVSTHITIHGN